MTILQEPRKARKSLCPVCGASLEAWEESGLGPHDHFDGEVSWYQIRQEERLEVARECAAAQRENL